MTAAMPVGTGLSAFSREFPDRFFDAGIAEQHAVTFAAGLAKGGFIPVVAVYSSFLQRAYDQILHDVCLQNLHIVFCVDRAGLVGEDGETHQGVFDISFLSSMPNMTLLAPANFRELEEMLRYAVTEHAGPIAIRYPRGGVQCVSPGVSKFRPRTAVTAAEGTDVCILSAGTMTQKAMDARELLKQKGISAAVVNLRTLYPLNTEYIFHLANTYPLLVTLEDGIRRGGVGEAIAACLSDSPAGAHVLIKAHDNPVVPHGKPDVLYRSCGLDAESVAQDILINLKGNRHESD